MKNLKKTVMVSKAQIATVMSPFDASAIGGFAQGDC